MAGRAMKSLYVIDYVFASQDWTVERLSVIFDGNNQPLVSDHYGLEAELTFK